MMNTSKVKKNALYFSNIVALTDGDGFIIEANDNFSRLSDYSKDELMDSKYNLLDPKFNNRTY